MPVLAEVQTTEWDDAVEFAYFLNRSMKLYPSRRSPSYKKASQLYCDLADAGTQHQQTEPVLGGKFNAIYTPEPYKELRGTSREVMLATQEILRSNTDGSIYRAQEANLELQIKLYEAINRLIGRDVYVEGMNPHENLLGQAVQLPAPTQ